MVVALKGDLVVEVAASDSVAVATAGLYWLVEVAEAEEEEAKAEWTGVEVEVGEVAEVIVAGAVAVAVETGTVPEIMVGGSVSAFFC